MMKRDEPIISVAQSRGRQMGNCPFHLEVCPLKFL